MKGVCVTRDSNGIPVLVTVGEKDLILRSETDTIVSSLPHAHLKVIQGADHGSYIVHSPVMGELLVPFFNAD